MGICVCDGRYEGCDHGSYCLSVADGQHSPHFCFHCDNNRVNRIDRVLDERRKPGYVPRHATK